MTSTADHTSIHARSAAAALGLLLAAGCHDDGEAVAEPTATGSPTEDDGLDDGSGGSADDGDTDPSPAEAEPTYLSDSETLNRISMALRGVRPSEADVLAVRDDKDALEGIVDGYLDDPRFGAIVRDLHNDALLLLADFLVFPAGFVPRGPVAGADMYALNRSITEAPLRLIEHVVMNDRPYTEIVTAEYTLADAHVAGVWGIPYDGDGDAWAQTQWQDEREHAGILSDPWLFQRYQSTVSNANRGRANAISRALLCYDFLSRDIEVDSSVDLADPDAVANAVVDNPACASCHQALDPLAGFLRDWFPAYVPSDEPYPFDPYVPDIFVTIGATVREPGYFGQDGDGLAALGQLIAEDPRFSLCAAQRFYAYFHQIDRDRVPLATAAALQSRLIEDGMSAKSLVKAIVLDDAFRVSHWDQPTERDLGGVKKARPVQLAMLMHDLTGFRWQTTLDLTDIVASLAPDLTDQAPFLTSIDLLADSLFGYGVLAGGVDALFVTRPSHTYGATSSLVLRNLAREAAHAVVDADFATPDPAGRRLLTLVDADQLDEPAVREQLRALHRRLFARALDPDDPQDDLQDDLEIDRSLALFQAALESSADVPRAWKVTLSALLQDVEIAYY